jgi:hypothetical protein
MVRSQLTMVLLECGHRTVFATVQYGKTYPLPMSYYCPMPSCRRSVELAGSVVTLESPEEKSAT